MSLYVFDLVREGFQESLSIGDVFEHEKSKFVVIMISSIQPRYSNSIKLQIQVVAQKVGTPNLSGELFSNNPQKMRISVDDPLMRNTYIPRIGEFLGTDVDETVMIVSDVRSIRYEFMDMIVTYDAEIIQEWSKLEIDKVVKENRLKKFKVIEGGNL